MEHNGHGEGHRQFASLCFNTVWDLFEHVDRSEDETNQMIDAAHASRYHWRMRDDVEPRNMAISSWQLSRVYSAAGQADTASRYGQESLDICTSNGLSPFLTGYALEALTRAAHVGGDSEAARVTHTAARKYAMQVEDDKEQAMLLRDIDDATVDQGGR
jgi:hypothetical protein